MKNLKKLLAVLLCIAMTFTFTACRIVIDGEENVKPNKGNATGAIGLSVSTQNNPSSSPWWRARRKPPGIWA